MRKEREDIGGVERMVDLRRVGIFFLRESWFKVFLGRRL